MAWLKLEAAIDAIHNKRTAATSREQLYRVSNEGDARTSNGLFLCLTLRSFVWQIVQDLCTHKKSASLYTKLRVETSYY